MGVHATKRALEMAQVKAEEIDFVIWGTLSPDHYFPGNSAWAQPQLGVKIGTPCMDIRNQCSFFVYGLTVADALIKSGAYKRILLIGSEIHSTGLDFSERGRDVAVLFGDGAGAVVLGPATAEGQGLLATDLGCDGTYADELAITMGSSVPPTYVTADKLATGEQFPKMNGKLVFKQAVTTMPITLGKSLKQAGVHAHDLDLFIAHQANLRICEFVQKTLELSDDKIYNNIHKYGNTTAASIPIALDECVRSGRLKRGQLLAVAAFGAGFTWGSAIIRY